jgi:hypothetical protein
MVKHIVMWDVNGTDEETPSEAAFRLRKNLSDLGEKVPSLDLIEVAVQEGEVTRLVLYSEFADWDALDRYRKHPDHQAVIPLLRAATARPGFVDYEV